MLQTDKPEKNSFMKRSFVILLIGLCLWTRLTAQTEKAPAPIAPYSQYVEAGNTLYLAGQIPIDPATGKLVEGDIQEQTRQVMKNIGAILEANEMDFSNLVMCTIYLTNLDHYRLVNEAYGSFFKGKFPARVAVEVSRLPLDAEIEIASIAVRKE